MQEYYDFTDDLTQRGAMKDGAPLDPISTARTVRVRDGQALVVDGPFAETKEQLGGFYVVECDTIDQADRGGQDVPRREVRLGRGAPGHADRGSRLTAGRVASAARRASASYGFRW